MFRTDLKVPQLRVGERKVTKQLAGLVDGGFEEGQYEAALASLDQIRSPEYSPLPSVSRLPFPVYVFRSTGYDVTCRESFWCCPRPPHLFCLRVGPTSARPHA